LLATSAALFAGFAGADAASPIVELASAQADISNAAVNSAAPALIGERQARFGLASCEAGIGA